MTGQYPIRNGLSLILTPRRPQHPSANAFTMGQLFKQAGYAAAIYGKWHLGSAPESLPTNGSPSIDPDESWDSCVFVPWYEITHSIQVPRQAAGAASGGKAPGYFRALRRGPDLSAASAFALCSL